MKMEAFKFEVIGGYCGGNNKVNKLGNVKLRLRILNTLNEKHDIKIFKP